MVQAARAYEYKFLQKFTSIDLDTLRTRRFTGDEYMSFVLDAETRIGTAYACNCSGFVCEPRTNSRPRRKHHLPVVRVAYYSS